ncbi:unnamed protein product [Nesidiocoris tenuis]|uniref:BZIP domain-containing protein n=1 Tax=Nesidiocoris tenuis TaxID=355587 RepID=A0A6H5GZZ8_9HEMI|nr:unnamed protein product [Nesidiocoris tenuis]
MAPTRKDPSTSRGRKKDHEGILDSSDDEGYRKKRDRNNMAVKRSRVKSRMKTQETVERVEQLKRENDQLVEKINLMSKELSFLKELFIAQASKRIFTNFRYSFQKEICQKLISAFQH